jgi:hypothetical protein
MHFRSLILVVIIAVPCDVSAQEAVSPDPSAVKPGVTATGEMTLFCGKVLPESQPFPHPAACGVFTMGNFPTGSWELNGDSGFALYSKNTGYLKRVDLSYSCKYEVGGYKGWVYSEKEGKRRWFFSASKDELDRPFFTEHFVNDSEDECGWEYRGTARGIPIPLE